MKETQPPPPPALASASGFVENIIKAPTYGYDGIDIMALLAAVMERYKNIPDNEKRAALQWFAIKYGVGD